MPQGQGRMPDFTQHDFEGVHCFAAREQIDDKEAWWLENLIPLAAGNSQPVYPANPTPLSSIADGTTTGVTYAMGFVSSGVPFAFVVFGAQGKGYVVNLSTGTAGVVVSGLSTTIFSTYATQYSNLGILIIDPNGYWDYGVTTPGTLTSWNNSVAFGTITAITSFAGNATVTQATFSGSMASAKVKCYYQVISAQINAAGTGYVVGDTLSLTDGTPEKAGVGGNQFAATIIVTAVGGGGAITGIGSLIGGSYSGPTTGGGGFATGPSGTVVSGGTGTGATFTVRCQAIQGSVFIVTQGSGVTNGTILKESTGGVTVTTYVITTSGVIGGQAIATYAGRVWIASSRTVFVTDINSYNSFGGAGFSFTINDSYLTTIITCLFAANNYLYLFGISSIDAISNVTVSPTTGLTSFSRINVVLGIGTQDPASVFAYYRGLAFFDLTGIYIMNGATPEKISEKITGLLTSGGPGNIGGGGQTNALAVVSGGTCDVNGELCATFLLSIKDSFSTAVASGSNRFVLALFFRRRWWIYTYANTSYLTTINQFMICNQSITSVPGTQPYVMGSTASNAFKINQTFFPPGGGTFAPWILRTKLWDGGSSINEKQAINAALAASWKGLAPSGVTFAVDTELANGTATTYPLVGSPSAYQLSVERAQGGSSQYIGLTIKGDGTDVSQVNFLALRGKQERSFLE